MLELHLALQNGGKEVIFIWVPGHVGMKVNSAAKDAIDGDISHEVIPFSEL